MASSSSTLFVSPEILNRASEALKRAKLDYAEAVLAMGLVWDKLMVSGTEDVLREEAAAIAAYDRAAARLDALEERLEAMRVALALGAPPQQWLH